MNAPALKTNLIDPYFPLLQNLSTADKLELIHWLSASVLTHPKTEEDTSWKSLFGAFTLDGSGEAFVSDLKKDRNFTRKEIEL